MKRSTMIKKMTELIEEVGDIPSDVIARSLLAMQTEAGMIPPLIEISFVDIDYTDRTKLMNEWEPEDV